ELLGVLALAVGEDGESTVLAVQGPGWSVGIASPKRGVHLINSDLASSQGPGIELHSHRILLRSVDLYLGHAVDHRNALRDGSLRRFVNVGQAQGRGTQRQIEDPRVRRI